MNLSRRSFHSQRGSVLIVALLLSAIIAISLASYIRLGASSQTISNRALYNNGAMNLAENGMEEAMYSINKAINDPTYTWSGWNNNGTGSSSDAWRRFPTASTSYTFSQNATGYVRAYVYNYEGTLAPKIVTRATVTLGGAASAPIEKWIEVTLSRTSKFANGLVAKNSILFKGNNATVDSWNSDPSNSGAFEPYNAATNRHDNGSVGIDSVMVKNADVWGYVSTNNGQSPADNVGNNGSILGADSPSGMTVDPSRVSTQFAANFDPVVAPTTSVSSIGWINAPGTYGVSGTATTIVATGIDVSGNSQIVTFRGDVTLLLSAAQAIKITGNGSGITVAPGSSLKIYTAGDIDLTGQGIVNLSGSPKSIQIYGTSTTAQDIKIAGGGTYSGVIYAPNGNVTINGDGAMAGSVVANNITLTGNAEFHYDESLGNLGGGNPFRVTKWKELTSAAARAAYSADLSF